MKAVKTIVADFTEYETGRVDYEGLKDSEAYEEYKTLADGLSDFPLSSLKSDAERIAFFLNVYNALLIHGVIALGEIGGGAKQWLFFEKAAYRIGGLRFSLNGIENGILRGNAGPIFFPLPTFLPGDRRLRHRVQRPDPRIHFALNCGFVSCPPIAFYEAEKLDEQLDLATRNYLNNGGALADRSTGSVALTRLFQWYGKDFGGGRGVLKFTADHLDDPADAEWLRIEGRSAKVRWLPYDFTGNKK